MRRFMLGFLALSILVRLLTVLGGLAGFQGLVVKNGWSFDEEWLSEFTCVNGDMARLIVGVAEAKKTIVDI